MGLIEDFRLDIGDDSFIFDNIQAPEIWGARVITVNLYEKQVDDVILFVNPTIDAPTIINMPPGVLGKICVIKDMKGDAAINNIILSPTGGGTIDGFTQVHMTQNNQSFMLSWNGVEWNII